MAFSKEVSIESNSFHSIVKQIPVKISEQFRPPRKITVSSGVLLRKHAEDFDLLYNVSLEKSIIDKMGQMKQLRSQDKECARQTLVAFHEALESKQGVDEAKDPGISVSTETDPSMTAESVDKYNQSVEDPADVSTSVLSKQDSDTSDTSGGDVLPSAPPSFSPIASPPPIASPTPLSSHSPNRSGTQTPASLTHVNQNQYSNRYTNPMPNYPSVSGAYRHPDSSVENINPNIPSQVLSPPIGTYPNTSEYNTPYIHHGTLVPSQPVQSLSSSTFPSRSTNSSRYSTSTVSSLPSPVVHHGHADALYPGVLNARHASQMYAPQYAMLQPTAQSNVAMKENQKVNVKDFEQDTSSPFDNCELKSINDMEELKHVLQQCVIKQELLQQQYNRQSMQYAPHYQYTRDPADFPSSMFGQRTAPSSSIARNMPSTPHGGVSNLPTPANTAPNVQSGAEHLSPNFPIPDARPRWQETHFQRPPSETSTRYLPIQPPSNPMSFQSQLSQNTPQTSDFNSETSNFDSQSSNIPQNNFPPQSNNIPLQNNKFTPQSSNTPQSQTFPAPTMPENFRSFIVSKEPQTEDSSTTQLPTSQSNEQVSRPNASSNVRVPSILRELRNELRQRRESESEAASPLLNSAGSPPADVGPSLPTQPMQVSFLPNPYLSLSGKEQETVDRIVEMGFLQSRTARALQALGPTQNKIIEFLIQVIALEEAHPELAATDVCEEALLNHSLDGTATENFLRDVTELSRLGFSVVRVARALRDAGNNQEKALDMLLL